MRGTFVSAALAAALLEGARCQTSSYSSSLTSSHSTDASTISGTGTSNVEVSQASTSTQAKVQIPWGELLSRMATDSSTSTGSAKGATGQSSSVNGIDSTTSTVVTGGISSTVADTENPTKTQTGRGESSQASTSTQVAVQIPWSELLSRLTTSTGSGTHTRSSTELASSQPSVVDGSVSSGSSSETGNSAQSHPSTTGSTGSTRRQPGTSSQQKSSTKVDEFTSSETGGATVTSQPGSTDITSTESASSTNAEGVVVPIVVGADSTSARDGSSRTTNRSPASTARPSQDNTAMASRASDFFSTLAPESTISAFATDASLETIPSATWQTGQFVTTTKSGSSDETIVPVIIGKSGPVICWSCFPTGPPPAGAAIEISTPELPCIKILGLEIGSCSGGKNTKESSENDDKKDKDEKDDKDDKDDQTTKKDEQSSTKKDEPSSTSTKVSSTTEGSSSTRSSTEQSSSSKTSSEASSSVTSCSATVVPSCAGTVSIFTPTGKTTVSTTTITSCATITTCGSGHTTMVTSTASACSLMGWPAIELAQNLLRTSKVTITSGTTSKTGTSTAVSSTASATRTSSHDSGTHTTKSRTASSTGTTKSKPHSTMSGTERTSTTAETSKHSDSTTRADSSTRAPTTSTEISSKETNTSKESTTSEPPKSTSTNNPTTTEKPTSAGPTTTLAESTPTDTEKPICEGNQVQLDCRAGVMPSVPEFSGPQGPICMKADGSPGADARLSSPDARDAVSEYCQNMVDDGVVLKEGSNGPKPATIKGAGENGSSMVLSVQYWKKSCPKDKSSDILDMKEWGVENCKMFWFEQLDHVCAQNSDWENANEDYSLMGGLIGTDCGLFALYSQ